LIKLIQKKLNLKIKINHKKLLQGSTLRRCPDLKKIRSLGFVNRYNIENGLNQTLDWYIKKLSEIDIK